MNKKLQPCPFCGAAASIEKRAEIFNGKYDELNSYVVICCSNEDDCGAAISVEPEIDSTDQELKAECEKAREIWNKRA